MKFSLYERKGGNMKREKSEYNWGTLEKVTLEKGESIPNPSSTKTRIHGPNHVVIQRFRDGGINTMVDDMEMVY